MKTAHFSFEMAALTNNGILVAVVRENQEELSGNNQSRDPTVLRLHESSFTQVSEEIEDRVTKKLSQSLVGWKVKCWALCQC